MQSIQPGKLYLSCTTSKIERGNLKNLLILKLECEQNIVIETDIVEEINLFKEGEKVTVEISIEKPSYTEKDFCAHGYLFYEKLQDDGTILDQISLYGLIVKISSKNLGLIKENLFKMMDHVYYCIKRS
ncbi:DNA-directed RNA polymerase subunit G [Stygiolobus azoricus]|uniref:DNA-directed RNA polymerase subunit Rpo8 n=1 Tax=Stygiolobus azoricus TaxID=41675 RepID=A0A650CLY8_9CREN|nr:DNA-directed RNA polymerase subunit G [Stygiolobus azoricus]QGR18876.1 DNA-directed RNA polymerase subunit G [Stygiolobus azoricus]